MNLACIIAAVYLIVKNQHKDHQESLKTIDKTILVDTVVVGHGYGHQNNEKTC